MTVIKEGKSYRKVGIYNEFDIWLGVNNPINHTFIDKYYYINSLKMIVECRPESPLTKKLTLRSSLKLIFESSDKENHCNITHFLILHVWPFSSSKMDNMLGEKYLACIIKRP